MKRLSIEAEQIMKERFGKDSVIALATEENGIPYVRYVNDYSEQWDFEHWGIQYWQPKVSVRG